MEFKENYNVILSSIDLSNTTASSFYKDLTSTNVISVDDINGLFSDIELCVDTLSSICTSSFCQFCQNTIDYYVNITDKAFPRVKYYNGLTNSVHAVFANSTINDIPLSDYQSINLLSYPEDETYNLVTSINGNKGYINGIERIIINGNSYEYTDTNRGRVNLGNYKSSMNDIVISINNQSGELTGQPIGIRINNTNYNCNSRGEINLDSVFRNYLTTSNHNFNYLYVDSVNTNNLNSVINLNYINNNKSPLKIRSKNITITSVDTDGKTALNLTLTNNSNFLSYIYGLQNGEFKRINKYINNASELHYEENYYQKGIPFTIVPLEDGRLSLISSSTMTNIPVLMYSRNYGIYQSFPVNTEITVSQGEVIAFSGDNTFFSKDATHYWKFMLYTGSTGTTVGRFASFGNIMSLTNWDTEIKTNYQFYKLFYRSGIVKAPQLPATTLKTACYGEMFHECTNLEVPPSQLPATTLTPSCYMNMFDYCKKMTAVPILCATTLAPYCCYCMFSYCDGLSAIPYYYLPVTTMEEGCYRGMFIQCHNLKDTPLLPATDLAPSCYQNMFDNCQALQYIHINADLDYISGTNRNDYLNNWLNGINRNNYFHNTELWNTLSATSGEYFYYTSTYDWLPNETKIARSLEDTPLSFELISGASSGAFCFRAEQYNLTSATVKGYSYESRKSYVSADMCPKYKYYNPTSKQLTGSASLRDENGWISPYWHWKTDGGYTLCHGSGSGSGASAGFKFNYCSSGKVGLIFSLSSNFFSQGYDSAKNRIIFWRLCHQKDIKFRVMGNLKSLMGWRDTVNPYQFFFLFNNTSHGARHGTAGFVDTHQVIMPSKNLGEHCYERMFENCSGMTRCPTDLPANILPSNCYQGMFERCTGLSTAPYLGATSLGEKSCMGMFSGCTNLTYFTPLNTIQNTSNSCCYQMFKNCSNLAHFPDITVDTIQSLACFEMFSWCSSLLYPPSLECNTIKYSGCRQMFLSNSLEYAPAITVTNADQYSFYVTFAGCKKMKYIYIPVLELKNYSFNQMLDGCSKLTQITVKFTEWDDSHQASDSWVYGVASTGKFQCSTQLDTTLKDQNHVPPGWTVENNIRTSKLIFVDPISTGDMTIFYLTK